MTLQNLITTFLFFLCISLAFKLNEMTEYVNKLAVLNNDLNQQLFILKAANNVSTVAIEKSVGHTDFISTYGSFIITLIISGFIIYCFSNISSSSHTDLLSDMNNIKELSANQSNLILETIAKNNLQISNSIDIINNNVTITHNVVSAIQGKLLSEGLEQQAGFFHKTAEILSQQTTTSTFGDDPEMISMLAEALGEITKSGSGLL